MYKIVHKITVQCEFTLHVLKVIPDTISQYSMAKYILVLWEIQCDWKVPISPNATLLVTSH